ncbi:MAG: hypothetical protein AAGI01_00775 [Myxococcota bacterium]
MMAKANAETIDPEVRAQAGRELGRAMVLLEMEESEAALQACERAVGLAPQDATPAVVRALVWQAMGRGREALMELKRITRAWPESALGHIHFAEACFLGGRERAGWRAMDRARQVCETEDERALWGAMQEAWGAPRP